MAQGSSTVPPPPTGDPKVDVQAAGNGSGLDRVRSIINRLSGGGTPAIQKALDQHHAQVVADAQRHADTAKRYYGMVAQARITGKNPTTGQPATPEEIAQWQQMADGAWADYGKIAGKAKAAKPIIQQMGGLLQHIAGGGKGQQGAGSQPPQLSQPQAKQGDQTVSPPPQGGASSSPQPTVPPPPGSNPLQESAQTETQGGLIKEQDAARIKDEEYRNKLLADADPRYHVNEIKQFRGDIQQAFPEMAPEDVQKAVLSKMGVTAKAGTGKEMQPDFKDGMLVGVKDPATNEYYTDPKTMPPAAKAIYDSAKKVEKEHESAQEAKEGRLLQRQMVMQDRQLQHALAASDYKAAKKIVDTAQSDYLASLTRQDTMHKNLASALKTGDQQAMLSLVANHIGMTLGAQKGARITRSVWDEAAASAPWWDTKMAKFFHTDQSTGDRVFDGWKGGINLAPEQMQQMVQLGDEKVDTLKNQVSKSKDVLADDLSVRGGRQTVSAPPSGKGPKVGDVEDGYKFKGGDPASQSSWERVKK
jgi:hypothetical protein